MRLLPYRRTGLIVGFLFGTVGIFLLALVSLMFPAAEMFAAPLLAPGRYVASVVTGPSASTPMVIFLYLCTGLMYAFVGFVLELLLSRMFTKKIPKAS